LRIMDTLMPPDFEYAAIPGRGPSKQIYREEEDGSWTIEPVGGFYRNVRKDWASYLVGYCNERLAVTRALGDFTMKKHGVIAEPSIVCAPPPAAGTTRAIVVASDGLWDCLQYAEVCVIVRRPDLIGNAEAATTELVAAALAAGERIYGSTCDNITAIVVYVTKTE
jgi:serine/threonine protein phosphatase PrpC